ncbi:MAG TPA: beta-galactosidase [Candidatus Limnocylindria bacterium]|nr:beta-galactosidase [Candidatus Limnocylindria bacterium]
MRELPAMSAATAGPPSRTCQLSRNFHRARAAALAIAFIAIVAVNGAPQPPRTTGEQQTPQAQSARGVEIVEHGGYPELRVDGVPFFIHSASFFYYRIPRDQWEALLRIYRSEGINTIDLYIPWNWHEPKEGEFDFDGHTNPRRDLRSLLAVIAQQGFKLIARPGPEILNEWRHGGYPGWLLNRPEYKMNPADWIEGRYPPLDGLNTQDAEAAARGWLENPTHMTYAHQWLTTVAKELAPFSSHHAPLGPAVDQPPASPQPVSGPLLFVQLGDDFAIGRANRSGTDFWRYVDSLRGAVEAGGVDAPVFINPTDMRVSAAGSSLAHPIGVMGQWYLRPRDAAAGASLGSTGSMLTASDASELEFFTEELKTQPNFPPVMIEYQAGWYTPADDDRPHQNPVENTLLSSRLLIANGIHGLNYMPLQDTYSPAGYSVPWANRSYRWNAPLGPDGDPQPRVHAMTRNSAVLHRWGQQLAGSHKRADFGILYPLGAYPQDLLSRADILQVSESVMRVERLATLAMLSTELLDAANQPVEQLLRDPMLLLPVFDPDRPQFQLSDQAQRAIVAYVRRGGILLVFPMRPKGALLEELWKSAPEPEALAADKGIRARWKFGGGEVIESTKDFSSWIVLDRSIAENRAQRESEWAMGVLREFMAAAGLRPAVIISGKPTGASQLIANEIVTNEGTGTLGDRKGGAGFLSLTNLSADSAASTFLEILSPAASAQGKRADYTALHVTVPPRESLLLPLEAPICFADPANAPCGDAVQAAGAEFLDARREGKLLVLQFYAPMRAEIHLRLASKPAHVAVDDNNLESTWVPAENELRVPLLRGAAPHYVRTLKLELNYKPHVPELEKVGKASLAGFDFYAWNAVRFPTSQGAFLRTFPPLILLDPNNPTSIMFSVVNHSQNASSDIAVTVEGPLHGSESYRLPPKSNEVEVIKLKPVGKEAMAIPPGPDGFLHGTIQIRSKTDHRNVPVVFLPLRPEGVTHYRYDFDRDGADEWVLENAGLRLIVSPESGGQIVALVDKPSGANLSTSVGLLRDSFSFAENPGGTSERRAHGRYGLFNRPYAAQWQSELTNPAVKLQYDAPDVFPAGAHIEKTIQFESTGTLRVDYRVRLNAINGDSAAPSSSPPQSFVAVNSFPAVAQVDHATLFCWNSEPVPVNPKVSAQPVQEEKSDVHCEDFSPNGKIIELPINARRMEVHTAGRPGTTLEWDCDKTCPQMKIEPKNFSALFRLQYPPLNPGAEAAQYTLRIRALGTP